MEQENRKSSADTSKIKKAGEQILKSIGQHTSPSRLVIFLIAIFVISASIIILSEVSNDWLLPHFALWEIHLLTIVGIPTFVTITAYFVRRKQMKLIRDIIRENVERKRAEETLLQVNRQHQLILNSAAEGILGLDLQGNHTFYNTAAIRMLGYTAEEFASLYNHSVWHHSRPDGSPYLPEECSILATLRNGKVFNVSSEVFWTKDGANISVEYNSAPIYEHGRITGAVITFVDVTERKQGEEKLAKYHRQLKELNATKDKLFSIIAHDLRGPLSVVLGFSELLYEEIKKDDIKKSTEFIEQINLTAKQTLIQLENLLTWAKTQTGHIYFNPQNIQLQPIIKEIVDTLNSSALLKNIVLDYFLSDNISVFADKNMLKTILQNLVSNALKFTHLKGKVYIQTVLIQNNVEITISDNGVGMNEETCSKLFRIDTTVITTGTSNERGSGFGLILCKEFVEMNGGRIWVESEVGKGSRFIFTLPLSKV